MKNVSQENSDGETVQKKTKTIDEPNDGTDEAVKRKKIKSSKKELATTCSSSTPSQKKKKLAAGRYHTHFLSLYHSLKFN